MPKQLLQRAEAMIAVVETVERVVAAEAERAALKGKPHRRTPAIRRACAQLAEPVTAGDYIQIELALAEE